MKIDEYVKFGVNVSTERIAVKPLAQVVLVLFCCSYRVLFVIFTIMPEYQIHSTSIISWTIIGTITCLSLHFVGTLDGQGQFLILQIRSIFPTTAMGWIHLVLYITSFIIAFSILPNYSRFSNGYVF